MVSSLFEFTLHEDEDRNTPKVGNILENVEIE